MLTDPPYGVSYASPDGKRITNDNLRDASLEELLAKAFGVAAALLRPGGAFYIFGPSNEQQWSFRAATKSAGWRIRSEIIWVKNTLVMGRSDYQPKHESILYGWAAGAAHLWFGGRKQTSVWEFPKPARSTGHPTMKPVAMLETALVNSSRVGDRVLDLFAGSGSTIIAAHTTGRIARAVELDPRYADVILQRWQTATGQAPVLNGEAVNFAA